MTYGIQETTDHFVNLTETALKSASTAASTGLFLVDVIPILSTFPIPEFVPGAGFQKKARIWRKIQEEFRERPYAASIGAMVLYLYSQ